MTIRLDGRVAIVTGAGQGLGRCHALALAARGARVVVNDLGSDRDGSGQSSAAAEQVVEEIRAAGGEAMANAASVASREQVEAMVQQATAQWGRVDILVNNAGILRDKSFAKGTLDDFALVLEVHLMGTINCCKAVWDSMREQAYGRIIVTTSSSGLYGNFGQTNYGAAKMAVVGAMKTLAQEGAKYDIRVNALAPSAGTRMTEGLMPQAAFDLLKPDTVSPAVVFLASDEAPTQTIIAAGAGVFATAHVIETQGVYLPPDQRTPEAIAAQWAQINDLSTAAAFATGGEQPIKFITMAAKAQGLDLSQ